MQELIFEDPAVSEDLCRFHSTVAVKAAFVDGLLRTSDDLALTSVEHAGLRCFH